MKNLGTKLLVKRSLLTGKIDTTKKTENTSLNHSGRNGSHRLNDSQKRGEGHKQDLNKDTFLVMGHIRQRT